MYTWLLSAFVEAEVYCDSSIYDVSYCCRMSCDKRQRNWENKSSLALFHVQRVNHLKERHFPYVVTPSTANEQCEYFCQKENVLREISTPRRVVVWKFRWKASTTMFTFAFSSPAFNNRFINILWLSPGWISVQEISFKHFGISITIQFPDRKPLNDDSLNFTPSAPRVWSLFLQSRQSKSFTNV